MGAREVERGIAVTAGLGTWRAATTTTSGKGHVDEEGDAPGHAVDEPTTGEGPDGGGDPPRPDHAPTARPGRRVEDGRDDGQAAGHEQGGADALDVGPR